MGAHDECPKPDGPHVGENMLNGVGIDGDDSSWSCPLMVDLVDVLVELWVVKEPVHKKMKNHIISKVYNTKAEYMTYITYFCSVQN